MSEIKVNSIKGVGASAAAITVNNTDGTCTANITNRSNRNLVINGAMNICQRGTTQNTINSNGYYVADRFNIIMVNIGSFRTNLFQSTQSPDGFNNSLGVSIGTGTAGAIASDERVSLEQRIESQNLQELSFGSSSAKSFTLSFYVKSTRAGQYGINMRQHDSGKDYNEKFDISSANTWEKKTITVSGNTGDTFADDSGIGLWFRIMLRAGSDSVGNVNYQSWGSSDADKAPTGQQTTWGTDANDQFYLTGVQLEVGSVATDFEHRSFHDELLKCYRYYNKKNPSYGRIGHMYTSSNIAFTMDLPCEMRASPTITNEGGLYFARQNGVALGLTGIGHGSTVTTTARIALDVNSNGAAGENAFIWAGNTFYILDSEL